MFTPADDPTPALAACSGHEAEKRLFERAYSFSPKLLHVTGGWCMGHMVLKFTRDRVLWFAFSWNGRNNTAVEESQKKKKSRKRKNRKPA